MVLKVLTTIALTLLLVGFSGNRASHAAPDEVTGCLSSKGKISKLALGTSPANPCSGRETQVSFGGQDLADILARISALEATEPEPKVVLLDDDQDEVGVVMDVGEATVLTLLTFVDSLGNDRDILLRAGRSGFLELNFHRPFFVTDNCTGDVWFTDAVPSSEESFLNGSAAVAMGESGEMVLFALTSDIVSEDEVLLGTFLAGGTCHDANFLEQHMFPAEVLVDDLHFDFPPPFTLVFE